MTRKHERPSLVERDCTFTDGDWRCVRKALCDPKTGEVVRHVRAHDQIVYATGQVRLAHFLVNEATRRARLISVGAR